LSALNDGTITYTATATDTAGNSTPASKTTSKVTAASASLSGRVFADLNNNDTQDEDEVGVQGILVTLHGVDDQGGPLPSKSCTTASDGSYQFTSLAAGTYSISIIRSLGLVDGTGIAGNLGGSVSADTITGIALPAGGSGTGFNFDQRGLLPSIITARMF